LVVGASQETVAAPVALLGLAVGARVGPDPGSMQPERSAATATHTPCRLTLIFKAHLPAIRAKRTDLVQSVEKLLMAQAKPEQRLQSGKSNAHARAVRVL
jgi:hypothetical protein